MYCRHCGKQISDSAQICIHCGVKPQLGQNYCWYCGKSTSPHQEICLECGVLLKRKPPPSGKVSGAWWLMPIFMGWLGGLIAWLVNREKDPEKARSMLITGIVLSVINFLLLIAINICAS